MIVFLSLRAITAFLQGPGVAVRVGEVGEASIVATLWIERCAPSAGPLLYRVLVPDRADRDAAVNQFRPLGREVSRNEIMSVTGSETTSKASITALGRL
jgi:hypothetical protein